MSAAATAWPEHGDVRRLAAAALPVTVALEGGGAMGAFTWGVLERLAALPQVRIVAISGTSAGAMNAALFAQGLATGGASEAMRLLEAFWRRVAAAAGASPGAIRAWSALTDLGGPLGPMVDAMRCSALAWAQPAARSSTNPLRAILADLFDPQVLGSARAPTLVVAATRVRTGEARLFRDAEVTLDALLASACLPQLFAPVEIGGEAYWDGGYASNPPIRALIEAGAPADVLIVRTTPAERPETPRAAGAVRRRQAELAFGTALRGELRSLALAQRLLAPLEALPKPLARLRDARVHMIGAEAQFQALGAAATLDASWSHLSAMRELGHEAAEHWTAQHLGALGR